MAEPADTSDPTPRRRWRRRLLKAAIAAVLILVLLPILVLLALRTESVRQALLRRVDAALRESAGISLQARTLELDVLAGKATLHHLALAAVEAPERPFLTVARLDAEIALGTALGPTRVLRAVAASAPRFDFDAPLPTPPARPDDGAPPGPLPVAIESFTVADGAVVSARPPAGLERWFRAWRVEGLRIAGALDAETLRLDLEQGRARLEGSGETADLDLDLAAALHGSPGGPYELARLAVVGEGLDLEADGRFGLDPASPAMLDFRLDAEPGRVLAEVGAESRLSARGSLDLRTLVGTVNARATALPGELVAGWVPAELRPKLALAGTHFALDADLEVAGTAADDARGSAMLRWRRGEETLLDASARIDHAVAAGAAAIPIDFEAALLPAAPGVRRLGGRLLAPALASLAEGRLKAAQARVESAELAASWAELAARWPALVPAAPAGIGGPLSLRLDAEGALGDPSLRLRARWTPHHGAAVEVTGEGRAVARRGRLRLDAAALDPARLGLPSLADAAARLGIDAIDSVHATLAADGAELTIETLSARAGERTLEASGRVALRTPIRTAALDLALRRPVPEVDAAGLGLRLDDGVLHLVLEHLETAAGSARGEAVVPLGALAVLPSLAPALDALPVMTADGTVTADLSAPRLDTETLYPLLGLEGRAERLRAAVTLHAELDPARPAASAATITLDHVEAAVAGRELAVEEALRLVLADGRLRLEPVRVRAAGQLFELASTVDLAPGWRLDDPPSALIDRVAATLAAGPAELGPKAPPLDGDGLAALAGIPPRAERLTTSLRTELRFDPRRPLDAVGRVTLRDLRLLVEGRPVEIEELVLRLGGGRLELERTPLEFAELFLHLEGAADLAPAWTPGDPPQALIRSVLVAAEGTVDASLLNPYLAGASARGPVAARLDLGGALERLTGVLTLDGPQAEIVLERPYLSRLQAPEVRLTLADGALTVDAMRARLNDGTVNLTGARQADGALRLAAALEDVRYRLDYGLSVVLDGDLELALDAAGAGRLGGTVVVERGLLRRYLDPDRELMRALLAPAALSGGGDPALQDLELDVAIRTVDGVRVKNNLADLRITWGILNVRGNLAAPRLEGRLDTDPGSDAFIYAYGQTARVDSASVTFRGSLEPEMEAVLTTSLEDPEVARQGALRFPAALRSQDDDPRRQDEQGIEERLTSGLAGYYGQRLAGRVGSPLGDLHVSYGGRLLVFGETDTDPRLTVGADVSSNVAFAAAVNLTREGRTTYVVDIHDLRRLPRLVTQVFRTDEEEGGVTLRQTVDLGGERADQRLPQLRRIVLEAPASIGRRRLKRAVGFAPGDRLHPGADFDVEVDVGETLRNRGYPGAEVRVTERPAGDGKVDLVVAIRPGPPVRFAFEGTRLPSARRRGITSIYRADFYEPVTLDEMRQQTVRALRAEGYLQPAVQIEVSRQDPSLPDAAASPRTVTVTSEGGERQRLAAPRFPGVDAEAEAYLQSVFSGRVERAELAAAEPAADARLTRALDGLGYPQAALGDRSREGDTVTVTIEPGPRRTVAAVDIDGIAEEVAAPLRAALIEPGSPARSDRIGRDVLTLEDALREQGVAGARVRAEVTPIAEDPAAPVAVTYQVSDGRPQVVTDIAWSGLRATRPGWAARATGLELGTPVGDRGIARARRRLFETGLFSAVVPDVDRRDDGTATLRFDVDERARYQLAYGGRWVSSEGLSVVVDAVDRNAFGRGISLGARARWADNDESGRLFARLPRLLGTRAALELNVEGRERFEDNLTTSSVDTTVQLELPIGEHASTRVYSRFRDSTVSGVIDTIFGPFPIRARTERPVLGWQWLYDSRDDVLAPTAGWQMSLDLSGADDAIGSDFSYLRFFGRLGHYWRLAGSGERSLVLAQSVRLGLAAPFDDQELLRTERFFAGGEYSVRGYPLDSLGPEERLGLIVRPLGGEALLVIKEELRFPIWSTIGGVVFLDAGNVWAERGDLGDRLLAAAGFGVRWSSPVGLLRGDIAFPLDMRDEDREFELYFGFGNTF